MLDTDGVFSANFMDAVLLPDSRECIRPLMRKSVYFIVVMNQFTSLLEKVIWAHNISSNPSEVCFVCRETP